jgi:preprotein translocase subunit SecA
MAYKSIQQRTAKGAAGRSSASRRSVPCAPRTVGRLPSAASSSSFTGSAALVTDVTQSRIGKSSSKASRRVVKTEAFFGKLFKSDPSESTRKKYQERVDKINALEPQMQALSDEQLRQKTEEFKRRVQGGESLESVLPEAFAVSFAANNVQ